MNVTSEVRVDGEREPDDELSSKSISPLYVALTDRPFTPLRSAFKVYPVPEGVTVIVPPVIMQKFSASPLVLYFTINEPVMSRMISPFSIVFASYVSFTVYVPAERPMKDDGSSNKDRKSVYPAPLMSPEELIGAFVSAISYLSVPTP